MVGNNALEDMIVSELGVRTFLITDNLENPEKIDVNKFENGNFDDRKQGFKYIVDKSSSIYLIKC